jgi:transcriptional regulator with XRE-family HTH domain
MPKKVKQKISVRQKAEFEALEALAREGELLSREMAEAQADAPPAPIGFRVDEPEKDLGQRLQDARRQAGLTQGELSARTKLADHDGKGIGRTVVSSYESSVNRPSPRELRMLCEVLRVSPNHLIYGTDDPFDGLSEDARFGGWGRTDAEYLAYLTYAFTKLHHHPRQGVMDIMLAVLRGWDKDFDRHAHEEAPTLFLRMADELRLTLAARKKP